MPRLSREGHCEAPGCVNPIYAKRICRAHYARQLRTGDVRSKNPPGWGEIQKHPLRSQWVRLLEKARNGVPIAPEWVNNFPRFAADVGERPSKDHRLLSQNPALPLSPRNFSWVKKHVVKHPGESQKSYQARAYKDLVRRQPDRNRATALMVRFGITSEQFDAIWEKQGRCCAICRGDETAIHNGKRRRPAVDHDARTLTIRGILCGMCNRGLGYFQDDPERLIAAAAYLRAPPAGIGMPYTAGRQHKVRGPSATRASREAALDVDPALKQN